MRTSSSTCRRYLSSTGIEVLRNCDPVFRVELPAPNQHPLSSAEVDPVSVEAPKSRMAVPFGEPKKQTFHLDASAFPEKTARTLRAETNQTFQQYVDLVERFPAGKLVHQFQHRPFRRRQHELP
ncbi:MAG: hypothetical protein OXI81_21705 [Paracoccaceae bacterium]|nr:hypothetical protein [Paracoccaceae bacterium]MDE2912106.1 hypothetical protein [Paracoccaceae bacterium]